MTEVINIETERTYLRNLGVQDAQDFYALNLDTEVIKYTGDDPFDSIEKALDFLNRYDQYEKYGVGRLAVMDKHTNVFLGWCGLKYSPDLDEYDIGFRFFRVHWNKGYATETANACLDFGFQRPGIDEIVGRAMTKNTASIRVLEKIGMTFKQHRDCGGQDGVIYSITKDFYENRSRNHYPLY